MFGAMGSEALQKAIDRTDRTALSLKERSPRAMMQMPQHVAYIGGVPQRRRRVPARLSLISNGRRPSIYQCSLSRCKVRFYSIDNWRRILGHSHPEPCVNTKHGRNDDEYSATPQSQSGVVITDDAIWLIFVERNREPSAPGCRSGICVLVHCGSRAGVAARIHEQCVRRVF